MGYSPRGHKSVRHNLATKQKKIANIRVPCLTAKLGLQLMQPPDLHKVDLTAHKGKSKPSCIGLLVIGSVEWEKQHCPWIRSTELEPLLTFVWHCDLSESLLYLSFLAICLG